LTSRRARLPIASQAREAMLIVGAGGRLFATRVAETNAAGLLRMNETAVADRRRIPGPSTLAVHALGPHAIQEIIAERFC
jgi:hypothetical protein